jgi:hypothetical protein
MVSSTIANVHLPKSKQTTPSNFLPKEEEEKPVETKTLIAMFVSRFKTKIIGGE